MNPHIAFARRWVSWILLAFWGMVAVALTQENVERVELEIASKVKLSVEVARTRDQMALGLMHRDQMPLNAGMIFLLGEERRASFWMKNTRIPLSIAYLDAEGVILELYDMKPHDLNQTMSRSSRVAYALEVNQGWFELNGIKAGDRVTLLAGERLGLLSVEAGKKTSKSKAGTP